MYTNTGGSTQSTSGSSQDSPLYFAVCEKLTLRLVLRGVDITHDYNRLSQALVHPKLHGTQAKCICIAWLPLRSQSPDTPMKLALILHLLDSGVKQSH